jgi:hypothetical protein
MWCTSSSSRAPPSTPVSPGGVWADDSDFLVRGCLAAEFPQGGNKGDGEVDDCRDLEVVLVHETSTASGASSRSFDKEFVRSLGGDRIRIESSMSTQNHIDLSGASSQIEGKVVLAGKIGKSFELTMARAFATAGLNVDPSKTAYEVGVDAFGQRIYGVSKQLSPIVESGDFSAAKSFTIGNLGFGFGPVSIGIKIGVGGKIGIETEDTLEVLADNATCQELLKTTDDITACGRMTRVTTPNFGLTGSVEGGIDIKIVKAAWSPTSASSPRASRSTRRSAGASPPTTCCSPAATRPGTCRSSRSPARSRSSARSASAGSRRA